MINPCEVATLPFQTHVNNKINIKLLTTELYGRLEKTKLGFELLMFYFVNPGCNLKP